MQSSLTTLCPNCGKELTADTQPAACPHCRYLFSVDLKSFIVPEDHGLCVKEIRTGIEKERFEEVG
ncbi:MAG TPA: hypothetical protein PL129_00345, partial [bacterium]|nr:hypothetical protein [bacterium]